MATILAMIMVLVVFFIISGLLNHDIVGLNFVAKIL